MDPSRFLSRGCASIPFCRDRLNQTCFCITLDRDALCEALEREAGDPEFCAAFIRTRPHLFSNVPVFLPETAIAGMHEVVRGDRGGGPIAGLSERGSLLGARDRRTPDHGPARRLHGLRFSSRRGRPEADRGEYERRWRLPQCVAGSSPASLLRRDRTGP